MIPKIPNPLCHGTKEHSTTSLICRRCDVYVKCYKAMMRNNYENKKRLNAQA